MKLSFTVATPDVEDNKILAMRGDTVENFSFLARNGYHGAELMIRYPDKLKPESILKDASSYNLEISAVSTGQFAFEDGLCLSSTNETIRRKAVERTKETVDFTLSLKASVINIGTMRGNLPDESGKKKAAMEAMKQSMQEILDYSEPANVIIAFEPQCRYIVNWHNSTQETFGWIKQFKNGNLRLLWDIYHANLEDTSVLADLIRYASNIAHIQFSDSNRLAPGQGHWDFREIIRILHALNYNAYVSVEVLQKPDSFTAAANAARYLLPLLSEVST